MPRNSDTGFDTDDSSGRHADNTKTIETPARACDACRKMKIKCKDKENPPCKRCRTMNLACSFDMGPVARLAPEENDHFMKATKTRLESLEGQVGGINQKLDDISSLLLRFAPPQAAPMGTPVTFNSDNASPMASMSARDGAAALNTPSAYSQSSHRHVSGVSPDVHWNPPSTEFTAPFAAGFQAGAAQAWQSSPRQHQSSSARDSHPIVVPQEESAVSDEEDPLDQVVQMEPLRDLIRREEEHRLINDGQNTHERPAKRKRRDEAEPEWGGTTDHLAGQADPVSLGICSEAEGKALFDAFFEYAYPFLPILDPEVDTWESLRKRSPFCITVILWVAAQAKNMSSDMAKRCLEHAEAMAKTTVFSPVATMETVQALTILGAWGDNGWRTGIHAAALATDMRLYRCLPYLHKIRSDSRRPNSRLERQRPLLAGARLWLAIVKQLYENSYNHGLPIPFTTGDPGEKIMYAREILDHPLANVWDSRLIVSVEISAAREPWFRPYRTTSGGKELDQVLRETNKNINEVYDFWINYYHREGLPSDHYLVKELGSQKAYGTMFTNSLAWYGVHTKNDIVLLSNERRQWLGSGLRAGAFLIQAIGSGRQEKDSEYGNHNFHIAIIGTARYVIRMVQLLPEVCDLYQVSLDIDKLLLKLGQYPTISFTDLLRRALFKAREQGTLPFTTLSEEAARATATSAAPTVSPAAGYTDQSLLPADFAEGAGEVDLNPLLDVWPEELNFSAWFPMADDPIQQPDIAGLGADMANWFPAS